MSDRWPKPSCVIGQHMRLIKVQIYVLELSDTFGMLAQVCSMLHSLCTFCPVYLWRGLC